MKLLDKYRTYREEKAMKLTREVQRLITAMMPDYQFSKFSYGNEKNYKDYIDAYRGWIYACASKNASSIASVPLRLYAAIPGGGKVKYHVRHKPVSREIKAYLNSKSHLGPLLNNAEDVEEITEHIFLDLMRTINPLHNGFEAIEMLGLSLDLTGNGYWRIIKDINGIPDQIWPLLPQYVSIQRSKTVGIEAYKYGVDDRTADSIDPDEIVHFRYPNPKDYFYGMGPMEAAQLPAALNQTFDEYEQAMLKNNAVIPFFLGTDQTLNEQTVTRLRSDVEKLHRGWKKAGRMGFFHSGLKPHKLAVDPKDVNYVEGHKITKEKIAAIFGVPMSLLGTDKVPRANADAGAYQYMKYTIMPRLKRIEQSINQDIMPLYDSKLFVSFDNPVPEDTEFLLKESDTRLKNWSMTINEYRNKNGEDEVDWGNEPLVQGQVTPLSESVPDEPEIVEMPPLPPEDETEDDKHIHIKVQSPAASQQIIVESSKWINSTAFAVASSVASIDISSPDSIDTFVPWSEIVEEGKERLGPSLATTLHSGAKKGTQRMRQAGINISWDIHNPHAVRWANEQVGKRITVITEQTRQAIKETVAESIRNGQALRGTRRSIQEIIKEDLKGMAGLNRPQAKAMEKFKAKLAAQGFSDATIKSAESEYRQRLLKQRSEMIARTETAGAWAEGNIASYREAGLAKKEFSSANDACPICQPLDGKTYNIGSDEVVIPLHPNCRCDWLPVIED